MTFEDRQERNHTLRKGHAELCPTIAEEIAYAQRRISDERRYLAMENWQIGGLEAPRFRAQCRRTIEFWTAELYQQPLALTRCRFPLGRKSDSLCP